MKTMLGVIVFALLTAVCWGVYGPVLEQGVHGMEPGAKLQNSLRAFVGVGLAYFLIAVVVPSVLLQMRGETGQWTIRGTLWSLIAGAAGALGAEGISLAFGFGGSPAYVMPLVFGGAPVVNALVTMSMGKTYKAAGPIFFAGLILVIVGAVTVLLFKPAPPAHEELTMIQRTTVFGCIVLALLSWGVYGPVLHKGQVAMQGSRLRPLLCVGLAYFLIAVLVPAALLTAWEPSGGYTTGGVLWSMGGGAAGAVGAIGIILAFNCGGKPVYVMPLVFGGAPVVNTFVSVVVKGTYSEINSPLFFAGLILVVAGAVTVLVFAPKGQPHAAPAKA